jgi:long-chain fatty acid transport protein
MQKSKLLLLVTLSLSYFSIGQGFQVNFQGQIQQGMGGAGTGLMHGSSAVFFNPGGMHFTENNGVDLHVTPVFARVKYLDAATSLVSETNSPTSTPFALYWMSKVGKIEKLKMGLGVYTPFGSTVQYEDAWTGRFALTRLQLQAIFIQPTLSYKITDKLGLGAGFVLSTGKVNLQRDIPVINDAGEFGSVELAGSALGFGYNVGLYYQLSKKLSIAATYRSQVNMAVDDGQATFAVPSALEANFPNGTFISSLPLPQVATLGFGYVFNEKLKASLDLNYVGWKAYDTLAFDYAENTASLVDTKSARNYKNIFAARAGVEYAVHEKVRLRAGLAYGQTPVQDGYVTPETPDANRINYTLGIGYAINSKIHANASLFYTRLERTDRNLETNLEGTFKTIALAPGISFSYHF